MVVQIVMNKSLTYYGANSVFGESVPLACAGIVNKLIGVFFRYHWDFSGNAADCQLLIWGKAV
jgi:hypothetical protein